MPQDATPARNLKFAFAGAFP